MLDNRSMLRPGRWAIAVWTLVGILLGTWILPYHGQAKEKDSSRQGTRLFFRLVGADSNAPLLPKSRSAWTQDRQLRTGTTGSSDLGFSEYPFCSGLMDFTFVEGYAVYPRIVSRAMADPDTVNTTDIVAGHVYQPDGCVWGWAGREFVQTFVARQSELVSVTMLVASEPGSFLATLVEGGSGGRQIGPAKSFTSGHSMTWGHARWPAGQAPLIPGHTYGIRIVRADGRPWTPYLHSLGNAYDDGLVYVDGQPRPESDLAAWIVEESADLKRALIHGTGPDGWANRCRSISFTPRSANVRLLTLTLSPVTAEDMRDGYVDMVARIRSDRDDRVLYRKRCLATGPQGGAQTAHFLFADDEFLVTPGQSYRLDAYLVPHKQASLSEASAPEDEPSVTPRDMRLWVYGEPAPGQLSAIYNLSVSYASNSGFMHDARVTFRWSSSFPSPAVIETWGDGVNDGRQTDVAAGQTCVEITKFWPGHTYRFRLRATAGIEWRTPLYEIRIPRGTEIPILRQEQYPKQFVTLAPSHIAAPAHQDLIRFCHQVEVVNSDFEEGDFEDGLTGWETAGDEEIQICASRPGFGVKWGQAMAGWFHEGDEGRPQSLAKASLFQTVPTQPGHCYLLSVWGRTSVIGGPRGNTRLRLSADPLGASDFGDANSSQWYWTDGRWMRLEHRWVASAERSTIALNLFRWWDTELSTAHVDYVTVYDLGPVELNGADPAISDPPASITRSEPRVEADDKVEAYVQAPPGTVITGIGARAQDDNITTLWLRVQPLTADGQLGPPEQLRAGWEPDSSLEAQVVLPPGYVATGFGAGIAPEWDVKRLRVWARPLHPDGTLGDEREFRGGADLESGVERQINLPPDRVLTSAGLNCMFNDVNGIRADSARLVRRAAAP